MGKLGWTATALAIVSISFQNCGQAFVSIDPGAKAEMLAKTSVFQGQGRFIYIHKTKKLRAVEDRNDPDQEGSIPVVGPNGEGVIVIAEPGVFGPDSGVIPAGGSAYGQVSVENGVAQGPNWYVPPPTVTITTTTTTSGPDNSAAIFGAFLGAVGAIMSTNSGGGGAEVTNYQSYVPTPSTNSSTGATPEANSVLGGVSGNPNCGANDIYCHTTGIPQCAGGQDVDNDPRFWAGKCHSPLLIAFNEDHEKFRSFELTNPLTDGRWFDIAGANSKPQAHSKILISWMNKPSYMFITLPNERGEVNGVDELFGNNTQGPDGEFAINGYEALRKFDLNGDGYITAQDPIFTDLRLWSDLNSDAIATTSELLLLSEKDVEVIDLNYNANYIEADRYGNLTAMKSAVRTSNGDLHLLFDLWFRAP